MAASRSSTRNRNERHAQLRWVPIGETRVNPNAQRELNQAWVSHLALNLDPEIIGTPIVSYRGGAYYVVDGQHRIAALEEAGWGPEQQIQCWVYDGLTEHNEAELFLKYNDSKQVPALPRFQVAVNARRPVESDVDRILHTLGLCVSGQNVAGAIRAVGTLNRVYRTSGPEVLARALRIIRDAYGDAGLGASVIDGMGRLCDRYDGQLDEEIVIAKLSAAHGGVGGLLNKAELMRRQTGNAKGACVAAAAVEIVNRGRGGKKLPGWFKDEAVIRSCDPAA